MITHYVNYLVERQPNGDVHHTVSVLTRQVVIIL